MRKITIFLFFLLCFSVWAGSTPAQAVNPTFFGATSSAYENSPTSYTVWWPSSSGGSTPPISFGSAGKENGASWGALDNNVAPGALTWVPDSSSAGGHWKGTPNWAPLDTYISAAKTSNISVIYSWFQTPERATCAQYKNTQTQQFYFAYGGPNGITPCPGTVEWPYNTQYTAANCEGYLPSGAGWCQGPGYNDQSQDIVTFAKQLVDHLSVAASPHPMTPVTYYEIWNEPDASGSPYWIRNSSNIPDWHSLINQTEYLENAITSEYGVDGLAPYPIFIGPAVASKAIPGAIATLCGDETVPTSCPTTGLQFYGFLNTISPDGPNGSTQGANLISIGTFHFYPSYDALQTEEDLAVCTNDPPPSNNPTLYDTALECTGHNLIDGVTNILTLFANFPSQITQVFMTEGGWWQNGDFQDTIPSSQFAHDSNAFMARYTALMASTQYQGNGTTLSVSRQDWDGWVGDIVNPAAYGTFCDDGGNQNNVPPIPPNPPPCVTQGSTYSWAGFGYGQIYNWMQGATVGPCHSDYNTYDGNGCLDTLGSVWQIPVTINGVTEQITWVWAGTYSCPHDVNVGGLIVNECPVYINLHHIQTLESNQLQTLSIFDNGNGGYTLPDEPFIFVP